MSHAEKNAKDFIGYEYKEIMVGREQASLYLDCYSNFGWMEDDNVSHTDEGRRTVLKLKRNRKIINKTELTRLQRNFEACASELEKLEKSKTSSATFWAVAAGMAGTVCMAASTFAVTAQPPLIGLCIGFALPGFGGWAAPYFIYKRIMRMREVKLEPVIEGKYEEMFGICEKGNQLLI